MICRVWKKPDGTIRLTLPSEGHRLPGEDDAAFIARIAQEAQARDPNLVDAVPVADMDISSLPPRFRPDAQGDPCECRSAWRDDGAGNVVVDDTKIAPGWEMARARIRQVVVADKRAATDRWEMLERALLERDAATVQAIYDRIKAAMARPPGPLTQAEFDGLVQTLQEKRIPFLP